MSDEHSSPIKTPKQLITVIVLAFVVPILVIVLLVKYVTGEKTGAAGTNAMTPEAIADRLAPVGQVALQAASTGGGQVRSGEAVYKLACAACHDSGAAGAPKFADAGAWAARNKQGLDTLVKHAIEGFKAMPAKGGNSSLSDTEVARAVVYMANAAGASFKEPAAPAAAAPVAAAPAAASADRTGQQIVEAACANCHIAGEGGAPKIGDRAAWSKRVSQGLDRVTTAAIRGHDGMPARGGLANITDAEMRKAVLYMFNQGGGVVAAAAPAAAAAAAPAAPAADAGKKLYDTSCAACHASGVAGAPKFGDKAAWAPRIKTGEAAMVASVIKGKGAMPPKGAAASATEAEIAAAVQYMVSAAK
ncbi:MAG TPA: c-type cytochrome [Burkholderiaceae bacterium]|nr:c-type cytochrome [Burkholderiaceae bacterium]